YILSFPTRRSSDLFLAAEQRVGAGVVGRQQEFDAFVLVLLHDLGGVEGDFERPGVGLQGADDDAVVGEEAGFDEGRVGRVFRWFVDRQDLGDVEAAVDQRVVGFSGVDDRVGVGDVELQFAAGPFGEGFEVGFDVRPGHRAFGGGALGGQGDGVQVGEGGLVLLFAGPYSTPWPEPPPALVAVSAQAVRVSAPT